MALFGGGYAVEDVGVYGGYGGGGYLVEAEPGYGYGYGGPQIIDAGCGYGGVEYVQEPCPQPYIVEEEIYAPAYYQPVEQQTYLEPIYGYEDPYGAAPFIDGLVDLGYNGPWPEDYYGQSHCLPAPPMRRRRPKHHYEYESDSDSSDDEHYHKHVHKHCYRQQNNGITKDDIQCLLDKFETALNLKYKRAQVTELEAENNLLKGLAKEKRDIQKHIAQQRRDLLLKEALEFNAAAPVPGRRNPPGQQVVSIDYAQNGGQAPRPIAPHYAHPCPPPPSRPLSRVQTNGGGCLQWGYCHVPLK